MNPVAISGSRVAPISVDLTLPNVHLNVLRGIEKSFRVDKPAAAGLTLVAGEWGVLGSDGTVSRPGASSDKSTFLCFLGTDRFDVAATGAVTLFMNPTLIVQTDRFVADSYAVGDDLTVNNNSGTNASVLKAGTGDWVVARVVAHDDTTVTYETVPVPFKKPA